MPTGLSFHHNHDDNLPAGQFDPSKRPVFRVTGRKTAPFPSSAEAASSVPFRLHPGPFVASAKATTHTPDVSSMRGDKKHNMLLPILQCRHLETAILLWKWCPSWPAVVFCWWSEMFTDERLVSPRSRVCPCAYECSRLSVGTAGPDHRHRPAKSAQVLPMHPSVCAWRGLALDYAKSVRSTMDCNYLEAAQIGPRLCPRLSLKFPRGRGRQSVEYELFPLPHHTTTQHNTPQHNTTHMLT
ncbi:unnamed protein product [Protopolystoma xenopodis]|uniref:Uncharacterized protein n=1 Tax=Protopolystoma xenopodis TaxID=117903 RepID=A0A3S5BDR3_9PLAT|nr:unnamed protein product [Protopolystoma xenopodis]